MDDDDLNIEIDLEALLAERPTLWDYLRNERDYILSLANSQVRLVLLVMVISAVIGIGMALLVWRNKSLSEIVTNIWAVVLTIPSLALLVVLIGPFGLGWLPSVVALVAYAQLPIVRNTIVGLRSVDPAITESARAMGMSPRKVLFTIQLPIAWPVIIAGLRVSSMMIFGISAIAAYVGGPGFGEMLFAGLANLGSYNSMNETVMGALGITILALIADALFVLGRRATTSRGLRV